MTVPAPELSVIILSTFADPDLPGAIQSIIGQDVHCEIIVANSGGGDVERLCSAFAGRIKIVTSEKLLYAGGARNLGLTIATAPVIAFLACDCRAAPGWARVRLERHRNGAAAVASSMMHDRPWNLIAWADHLVLFPRRLRHLPRKLALRYSASYTRALLDGHGPFDETLRTGEDTEYHSRLAPRERPVWAGNVITIHRNNTHLLRFITGQYHRGRRHGIVIFNLRGYQAAGLSWRMLVSARQVPALACKGLRGRDRLMALASLPVYVAGLAAKLFGVWSVRHDHQHVKAITFTKSPSAGIGRWLRREPRIYAAFSFRYDDHLVPALIDNIAPIVDGWVCYDDRQATEVFSNEVQRHFDLIAAAKRHGADWILAIDPDERIERNARRKLVKLVNKDRRIAWSVRLRELYEPGSYRVDGLWGKKRLSRFFPAFWPPRQQPASLHGNWFPDGWFPAKRCNINLYHLKMLTPQRRLARSRLYKFLDPENRFQPIGYDYLADDGSAIFETIPPGREFHPPHAEDGGLWCANIGGPEPLP